MDVSQRRPDGEFRAPAGRRLDPARRGILGRPRWRGAGDGAAGRRARLFRPRGPEPGDRKALTSRASAHFTQGSLQFERLIAAAFVKRGAPYLVRRLVLGAAEAERGSETEIEAARRLQRVDQLFRVELGAGPLDRLDQDVGGDIALERNIVGCLA